MKCPAQNHSQVYEQKGALPTENWHLPSTSTKIKSWPLQLLTFNSPEMNSGWKSGKRHSVLWEKMAEQAFIWLDLFRRRFYESQFLHLLIPRETLTSLMVTSALSIKENFTIKSQNRVAMVQTTREITRWLVQFNCCRVRLFATPWIKACQASLSITNSQSSNSCPSSQWCHPTISSSVVPFSFCPQSLQASGSFPMSQLFALGG